MPHDAHPARFAVPVSGPQGTKPATDRFALL